jgi:hypothetical protein
MNHFACSFSYAELDVVPISPLLHDLPAQTTASWRDRRKEKRVLNKCQLRLSKSLQQLEFLSSLPPPSFYKTVIPFIQSFNPAEVARPFLPKLSLLPENPSVSVDLQTLARRTNSFIAQVFPILAYNVQLAEDAPLIVDSGALVCITSSLADFKHGSYCTSHLCVKDLSGENPVAGEGIIQWKVEDESGVTRLIEVPGVHIVSSLVRLLSPQVLLATSKDTVCLCRISPRFSFICPVALLFVL